MDWRRQIHTRIPIATLELACTNIHFGARLSQALPGAPPLHTHTSCCLLENDDTHKTYTHTHPHLYPCLIAFTNSHTPRGLFLFYTYRSGFLTRMQRYMQLAILRKRVGLLTVDVYSSNHWVLYALGISITKRFWKNGGSSISPFVALTKMPPHSSALTVE